MSNKLLPASDLRPNAWVVLRGCTLAGRRFLGEVITRDDVPGNDNFDILVGNSLLATLPWGAEIVIPDEEDYEGPNAFFNEACFEDYKRIMAIEAGEAPVEPADDSESGTDDTNENGDGDPEGGESDDGPDADEVMAELSKLNRPEMAARATKLGVTFDDDATKAEIMNAVQAHLTSNDEDDVESDEGEEPTEEG